MNEWLAETITPGVRVAYEARQVLHSSRTGHQELRIIDNGPFGRVMMIDGATQVTSADEFIYHEMMSHVPLLTHGSVSDVLIVGGGDCGLAREVLKHPGVRTVVQVEIDPEVIDLARRYFADANATVFDDPRFSVHIGDGAQFVAETRKRFDAVLIDSTDPVGPGAALFSAPFYRHVRDCLKPRGVAVAQCGVPFLQRTEFAAAMRNLAAAFPIVRPYLVAVPSYFGGHMALGWASSTLSPDVAREPTLTQRAQAIGLETRYYTAEVHKAAFALPPYIRELVDRSASPPEPSPSGGAAA